jgi:phosphotransferase system enzyme I (PtsI)
VSVELRGNAELEEEVPLLIARGARGIGLFRTEFLFLGREDPPTEEDHYQHARRILEAADPHPVTFRTFDLGGEKFRDMHGEREANPVLGLRAIRLSLTLREVFEQQLRGLLRASVHGPMRIMLPMISGIAELHEVRAIIGQAAAELAEEGKPVASDVPVGIMIEMPSAVIIADLLARESDFFAVGTNDLIQYSLGVDRQNEKVAHLFQPLHPAILRMLRRVAEAAEAAGIPLSCCGEMAGNPRYTQMLLGLGYREMSMATRPIPLVKRVVRGSSAEECRDLAERALAFRTAAEAEELVERHLEGRFPGLRTFED